MSTVCVAEVKTINLSLLLVWFAETGKLKALFLFDSYCWTSSEQVWFVQSLLGTPWWPSGQDSRLSLPKVQVHSLVGELRFCKPCGMAKKKKKAHALVRKTLSVSPLCGWECRGSERAEDLSQGKAKVSLVGPAASPPWRQWEMPLLHSQHFPQRLASRVPQLVKSPPGMQETWVQSLSWEDLLEKG